MIGCKPRGCSQLWSFKKNKMDIIIQFAASLFALFALTYIIDKSIKKTAMITSSEPLTMPPEFNNVSIGQERVRVSFNPSSNSLVDDIKQKSADLIDLCQGLKSFDGRLASLAQTAYEEGAMWAVKAATTNPPPISL